MRNADRQSSTGRAFLRELPGGGFAAIDISVDAPLWRRRTYRGTLTIERRANWRAAGHPPPVIGSATGPTSESIMRQLLPVAQSNVAIATALCSRDGRRTASVVGSPGARAPA